MNPHLWVGIRDFTIERQVRAIEGWQQLMSAQSGGRKTDRGAPAIHATGECTDGSICRGGSWGPHGIHICDLEVTWL